MPDSQGDCEGSRWKTHHHLKRDGRVVQYMFLALVSSLSQFFDFVRAAVISHPVSGQLNEASRACHAKKKKDAPDVPPSR
jgi:hypothetical protein